MNTKSVLSQGLKNFVIVTFIIIEIIGAAYSYFSYKHKEEKIINHYQEYKIDQNSLKTVLHENKSDNWYDFIVFSLVVAFSGLIGNALYQRHFRKIQNDFKIFSEKLTKSVKEHEAIQLSDDLKYVEFLKISETLNTVLKDMDITQNYNSLTKLSKRHKFLKDIAKVKNTSSHNIIVCYIYFKGYEKIIVNKGFAFADKIILELSKKITELGLQSDETRIGKISGNGDFLFAFPCTVTPSYCIGSVSDNLHRIFKECMKANGEEMYEQRLGLGFDILKYNCTLEDCNESLNNAFRAAVLVSEEKDKLYFTYSQELREKIQYGVDLEKDLKIALDNNALEVYYQGKVNAKTNKLKGAEALVRWKRNDKFENTEVFIKIAEKTELIIILEKFVINKVISTLQMLQNKGIFFPISINISAKHLSSDGFLDFLIQKAKEYNIEHKYIEIEIIEREKIDDECIKILQNINDSGFSISIDDFGKDYSSLSYMNNLPIDSIKIDKCFIDGLDTINGKISNENSKAIVEGIIKIAKSMNKIVIAEGVETKEQVDILKELGCDQLQGYYYHKGASPIDEFLKTYEKML